MDTLFMGNYQCSRLDLVFLCNPRRLVKGLRRDGEAVFAGNAGLITVVAYYLKIVRRNKQDRTYPSSQFFRVDR